MTAQTNARLRRSADVVLDDLRLRRAEAARIAEHVRGHLAHAWQYPERAALVEELDAEIAAHLAEHGEQMDLFGGAS